VVLGFFYKDGEGTDQNEAFAFACFQKAAEMGYTLGQHQLGECYILGIGTAIDVDQAAVWFERAAAAGFEEAQYLLGNILGGHLGPSSVPIDHKRAFELNREAAERGYGPAQADLATAYESGLGVPPSLEQSILWERRAAMQGVVAAQRNLVGSYWRLGDDDDGVPATAPIVMFWGRKAAAAGDPVLLAMELMLTNRCWYCKVHGSTLSSRMLRCSRCKESLYCSVEHQKVHWKVHKRWCDEVKAASEEYEQTPKNPGFSLAKSYSSTPP
jgi:TPR repeat protein